MVVVVVVVVGGSDEVVVELGSSDAAEPGVANSSTGMELHAVRTTSAVRPARAVMAAREDVRKDIVVPPGTVVLANQGP